MIVSERNLGKWARVLLLVCRFVVIGKMIFWVHYDFGEERSAGVDSLSLLSLLFFFFFAFYGMFHMFFFPISSNFSLIEIM